MIGMRFGLNLQTHRIFIIVKVIHWLALLCVSDSALFADSRVVRVDPSVSLQESIRSAEAGDTIVVTAGLHRVSEVEVDKSLTIMGEAGAILDGAGKGILHILADYVEISGLEFTNVQNSYTKEHAAIHLSKVRHFSIRDNRMHDIFFGVLIEKSAHGVVAGNTIKSTASDEYNSGNGIHLWHCKDVLIDNNEVTGMRDGIYFEFVSESLIINNQSFGNLRYGLHFMFSNNDDYHDNTFTNNGAGVAVMFSKNIKMFRNKFIKNWGTAAYGLLLKEINDATIEHNHFEQNTIAIKADGVNRVDYAFNEFISNGWAIKITGACYENDFRYNNFLTNTFDVAYQGRMNENKFSDNYWSAYKGYDLNLDGVGDVPYRPVKLFSYVVNRTPEALVLLRSLFVDLINLSEKVSPVFTPDQLIDTQPRMQRIYDSNI